MKKNVLYNKINKEELIVALSKEPFKRITASFYRYANVPEPINLRNELYIHWEKIKEHPLAYKYQKRAFSCLTKLRKFDLFPSNFKSILYFLTPLKSLISIKLRDKLLNKAYQYLK